MELGIEKQMAARQERPSALRKIGGKADFVNEAKPRASPLKTPFWARTPSETMHSLNGLQNTLNTPLTMQAAN